MQIRIFNNTDVDSDTHIYTHTHTRNRTHAYRAILAGKHNRTSGEERAIPNILKQHK